MNMMTMLQLMMMTMRYLAGSNIVPSSNPELILDSFLKAGDFLLIVVVYIKMLKMVKKLTPFYVICGRPLITDVITW